MMSDQKDKPSKEPSSDSLPLNMIKTLRNKHQSNQSESGSSNGGNSDNSALVSFGNGSFGFNFDSEEGNSTPSNAIDQNENSSDSDGPAPSAPKDNHAGCGNSGSESSNADKKSSVSTLSSNSADKTASQMIAANKASADLMAIATASMAKGKSKGGDSKGLALNVDLSRKRKAPGRSDNESGGYNSDVDDENESKMGPSRITSSSGRSLASADSHDDDDHREGRTRKGGTNDNKRQERNAREKERSFRISKQINELRDLLSSGGVIVPKGTKSSVLTEAANYIRMLQQHQYRSEIDRHQLIQQMQLIGSGAQGQQAAAAIRHVAAQNGVWSLGNFGGVPPKSAMSFYTPAAVGSSNDSVADSALSAAAGVDTSDYRFVFNSCGVGMAIASMGGALIDCNQLFSQLSGYTKQELCSLTVFNLTARQDLQQAFDLISQMISPPMGSSDPLKPIVLRGSMKNRDDIGVCISLVKGDDGVAKCFCITLVKNPASPFDTSKPVPVSFESVLPSLAAPIDKAGKGMNASPAFTSG